MNRAARLFQSFIGTRNGRDALTFEIDVDTPAVGSRYPSPLGVALCVFSESAETDEEFNDLVAQLIANSGTPKQYRTVVAWMDARPAGWWFLSHYIDNEVLSRRVIGPFDHGVDSYLIQLRDYQTVQTASRRLTFVSEDSTRLVDYVWDTESFAVFLHAELIEDL